jgi:heme-degrading monooxygenase HmoA
MIAMQYGFVLPGDYDMAVVRERIATKGPLLDELPGLVFKAYLHASAPEKTYAPFYLWRDEEAMHGFLNSPAFAGVARAFGWPSVKTWTPWQATMADGIREARFATRSSAVIAPYAALAELRLQEEAYAQQALALGALAVVIGFEPVTWTIARLLLWRDAVAGEAMSDALHGGADLKRYDVGHLSAPGA